jgi:hypothetical protein
LMFSSSVRKERGFRNGWAWSNFLIDWWMKVNSKKWYRMIGGSKYGQNVSVSRLAIRAKKIALTNRMNWDVFELGRCTDCNWARKTINKRLRNEIFAGNSGSWRENKTLISGNSGWSWKEKTGNSFSSKKWSCIREVQQIMWNTSGRSRSLFPNSVRSLQIHISTFPSSWFSELLLLQSASTVDLSSNLLEAYPQDFESLRLRQIPLRTGFGSNFMRNGIATSLEVQRI